MIVIADTCLCEYTDHGHCGVVKDGEILNDESLELLAQTAVSQAKAGADIIAPSNMMDGFVTVIREALDKEGFTNIPIMSYAVKYSSEFYGPFRDAADSTPQFGDRKHIRWIRPTAWKRSVRLNQTRQKALTFNRQTVYVILRYYA